MARAPDEQPLDADTRDGWRSIAGERERLAQIYRKRGTRVPMHSYESGEIDLRAAGFPAVLVDGEEIVVGEGEALHIPPFAPHQAEALEDTFELDVFSPVGQDCL